MFACSADLSLDAWYVLFLVSFEIASSVMRTYNAIDYMPIVLSSMHKKSCHKQFDDCVVYVARNMDHFSLSLQNSLFILMLT